MIKASELRLGNIVGFVMSKNLCYVSSIGEDGFITTTGISNNKGEYNAERGEEDMMPIALTPEILEKVGFVEDVASPFGGFVKYISQDEAIRIVKDEFLGYCWPLYGNTKVKVNHFHQLQNLYHSLTGEELTINL